MIALGKRRCQKVPMVRFRYALERGGPKRLEISYGFGGRNCKIHIDGIELASFPNVNALKSGWQHALEGGSTLQISLDGRLLRVYRDGEQLHLDVPASPYVGQPLDPTRPKLGLLSWGLAGGFICGKVPGSMRGAAGVALLLVGVLRTAGDPMLRPLTLAFLIVALLLILSGYNSYSKAYDKATENAKTRQLQQNA